MKYKMVFKDIDTDDKVTVYENSVRKGFRLAFRKLEKDKGLRDRELMLDSKVINQPNK